MDNKKWLMDRVNELDTELKSSWYTLVRLVSTCDYGILNSPDYKEFVVILEKMRENNRYGQADDDLIPRLQGAVEEREALLEDIELATMEIRDLYPRIDKPSLSRGRKILNRAFDYGYDEDGYDYDDEYYDEDGYDYDDEHYDEDEDDRDYDDEYYDEDDRYSDCGSYYDSCYSFRYS